MYFKRMLAIGALMLAGITGSLMVPDDAQAQRWARRHHHHHHGHMHYGHHHHHHGYYYRPYSYYYRPYYYGNYYRYPYYYGRGVGIGRGGIYIGW